MTDLLAPENDQAFTEAYKTQVPLHMQSQNFTAEERSFLRKLITSHDAWPAYRKEWSIDASSLDKRRIQHFAATRDFDVHTALVSFHEERQRLEGAPQPAPEAIPAPTPAKPAQDAPRPPVLAEQDTRRATAGQTPTFAGDAITQAIAGVLWTPMLAAVQAEMHHAIEAKVGSLPTTIIEIKRADGSSHKLPSTHHPMLPLLITACGARMVSGFPANVWIAGPTGSGKSHAAQQVAEALGLPFHVQGAMSQSFELLGFIDAGGHYHDTPFRRAFQHGGVVLLDEIDAGSNEAMLAINGATANGGASFPDGYIKRHPDCVIIGAANTWGAGATAEYVGRSKIDNAILSRFPIKLGWDYDVALEIRIAGNEAWAKRVQDARRRARAQGVKHLIDPRHSQAGAALIAAGLKPDDVAKLTYLAGLKPDQIMQVEGRAL